MKTYLQKHSKIKYSDHWKTPKEIYDYYVKEKNIMIRVLLEQNVDLEFIKGRLKFNESKASAPFPSVLVHLGGKV